MPAAFTNTPSVQTLDFEDIGPLIRCVRLCGSCSSGQRFAMGFLPTNTSRCRSCPSARPSFCKAVNRLTCSFLLLMFTVQQVRPAGRTKEKGGISDPALQKRPRGSGLGCSLLLVALLLDRHGGLAAAVAQVIKARLAWRGVLLDL